MSKIYFYSILSKIDNQRKISKVDRFGQQSIDSREKTKLQFKIILKKLE